MTVAEKYCAKTHQIDANEQKGISYEISYSTLPPIRDTKQITIRSLIDINLKEFCRVQDDHVDLNDVHDTIGYGILCTEAFQRLSQQKGQQKPIHINIKIHTHTHATRRRSSSRCGRQ